MAQRRSKNRRLSSRRSANGSGFLDDNTNVYEGNDPLWFNRTVVRPSTSIIFTRNDSSILNPDSTVDISKLSPDWHKNLSQSNNSKLMEQAVQKNISERLNNEQSDSSRADPTTESESEHESQKRRANFKAHQAKSNKSEKSNVFLKALEETTESHTRNLKNYTTVQESESEHEFEKKRTRFRATQKKGDKSEKSNVFLRALEETTNSHTKSLTIQTAKDQESESTHDESTASSQRLRPKLFGKSNSLSKTLSTEQTSQIHESKSIHNDSTSSRSLQLKIDASQTKSNRNSLQKSVSKSANESKLGKSLDKKLNERTANQEEIESSVSSQTLNGDPQLNNDSDEDMYDGSYNRNETSQSKSLKEKLKGSQFQEHHKVAERAVHTSQNDLPNDESDEESMYDLPIEKNDMSKNKSLKKKLESSQSSHLDNEREVDPESQVSHNLRKKNLSNIVNASHKNVSTKRKSTINEAQDSSKTLERNSLHKIDSSKGLSKSRKRQSQSISEVNESTAAHNSDEENSTMPKYIRRTQSRLFQKSERVDNEENLDNENNESSKIKNKTQESSTIHEKSSLAKVTNTSQNSPSLRKRQTRTTSIPSVIEARESDEENSTIPKYIRRTKSRLFSKIQTTGSENVFDEVLSPNRLSKNSEAGTSHNSIQASKSMLRETKNLSASLMKPRVILTRVQNPDSSTESQKENRLATSRTKNLLTKSKRPLAVADISQDNENSTSKSKQQKVASVEYTLSDVSRSKYSPRKSKNQIVNVNENQSDVSLAKNSPRKLRNQKASVEENRSNISHSKNSQTKSKQQVVYEDNNEADVSRGKNSLKKSKHQATIEASENYREHTISLPEQSNRGGSKEVNLRTAAVVASEKSRSNSYSSVETSSDRTPQEQEEQGAQSDSSALPSDELLHTPNPAQSTLKLSGKPLKRLTQFSFKGWEQESIIAPVAPKPTMATTIHTRTIAEEQPAETSPQHPAGVTSRHPPETITRPASETPTRHTTKVSSRHPTEMPTRHSTRVSSRSSVEKSSENIAEVPSRRSTRSDSRSLVEKSPENAPEVLLRHSIRIPSRSSVGTSPPNTASSRHLQSGNSSRHPVEVAAEEVSEEEDNEVDIMNNSDVSHVSDFPLLTRQLNEIPYENERTTDNEEPTPSINAKTFGLDYQIDQNVSTIDKATWAEVKKKTDAFKMMMEARMKREQEHREQQERQRQQRNAKLKRIMVQKAAEKRKRQKKPVDSAFLVNGKEYKQPKLPRPQKWATDRLYRHLWKCMEPRYGVRTRVKSEAFVLKLANFVKISERRKKYENYETEFEDLLHTMAKLNIISTRYDFYRFCWDFMPYNFRMKVRPTMMPGNVRNIPYNSELTYKPILSPNDTDGSDRSESESEEN